VAVLLSLEFPVFVQSTIYFVDIGLFRLILACLHRWASLDVGGSYPSNYESWWLSQHDVNQFLRTLAVCKSEIQRLLCVV